MNGVAPVTPGTARMVLASLSVSSFMVPPVLKITACEVTPTILSRKSVVKPFMTLMTTISEATPRDTPATEIHEITEMNACPRRANR